MNSPRGGAANTALVPATVREPLSSAARRRSVKAATKRWQPPEGLSPDDVQAVIAAAACEHDRLLLTTLWATGARISEVLALRPRDVRRQGLTLPNLKNPSRPVKTAHPAAAHAGLPANCCRGRGTTTSRTTSRCSSPASAAGMVGGERSTACAHGRS